MNTREDNQYKGGTGASVTGANSESVSNSDEIDLIEVIRHIWNGRWLIIKITAVFVVLGLVIALTSTEQYESRSRMLPEIVEMGGQASRLAQQVVLGDMFLLREGGDAIRPGLYPDVLKSTPFYMDLLDKEIMVETSEGVDEVTLFTYMDEHIRSFSMIGFITRYTIRLPWTILGWIRGSEKEEAETGSFHFFDQFSPMTKTQHGIIKNLENRINASIDNISGVITVSAEFPDPVVSAQVAHFAVEYLTDYITEYRTEKAQQDLEFVTERYEEKKNEFHEAQLKLARFRDDNRNIVSAVVRTEEERLQNQYNIAFNVYNNMAQQLERSRIQVQEKTPVIKILEPVQVPMERSKPRRSLIMVISVFLGGFLGVGAVYGKIIWGNIRDQLKEG